MKAKFCKLIIKLFGNIQFFRMPFFLVLWGDTHYKIKGPELRHILVILRKGDILLRRYDRYVSGWFIPGYWTHAALMATDNTIIHATTHGVQEEDVLTFLRADGVAILRYKEDPQVAINAADMSRSILGREYDFFFDTTDDSRLFCTELVKYCYPGILDDLGNGAIPPDKILKADLELLHESRQFRG